MDKFGVIKPGYTPSREADASDKEDEQKLADSLEQKLVKQAEAGCSKKNCCRKVTDDSK